MQEIFREWILLFNVILFHLNKITYMFDTFVIYLVKDIIKNYYNTKAKVLVINKTVKDEKKRYIFAIIKCIIQVTKKCTYTSR